MDLKHRPDIRLDREGIVLLLAFVAAVRFPARPTFR
jgi:hypothetical protein